MENSEIILETKQICKSYGEFSALKNTNLHFENKKIYGLFGRNGAGKTTLLDIISSRIFADSGQINFFAKDSIKHPEIVAQNCCYMPEKHYFPARLKVKKLLSLAKISFSNYSEKYADKLCQIFNLNTELTYGQLSRGHQSIFRIVFGLASRAQITIFDEPVLGMDAAGRDRFYSELISEFSRDPRLFIISTHFIEESADLFNETIIIEKGEIIRQAPVEELLSKVFYVSGKSNLVDNFITNRNVISFKVYNNLKTAIIEGELKPEKNLPGLTFSSLTIQKLFIHLTEGKNNQERLK